MITAPIFLVLYMHIRLTKLLEDSVSNAEFDIKGRICPESTSLD